MELDDSFTERLLQRNKARKQYLNENEAIDVIAKKRSVLVEDQQILNQGNAKDSPEEFSKRSYEETTDDSPKRQCLEQFEGSPSRQWPPHSSRNTNFEKENAHLKKSSHESFVPFKASFNVRGLAALRNKDSDSSVVNSGLTSEDEGAEKNKKSPLKTFKPVDDRREYIEKEAICNDRHPVNNFAKHKLKLFGNEKAAADLNKSFDPTDLPLSARKALFEQAIQKEGEKPKEHYFEPKLSVAQRAALFENASKKSSGSKLVPSYRSKPVLASSNLSPCKLPNIANLGSQSSPQKSLPSPQKTISEENNKALPPGTSPIKKINTDTRAVEQMLLARVNSNANMKESNSQPTEGAMKGNANLVNYWEKLSASTKAGNSNSEEELSEKNFDVPESDMYQSDQEGYESETESKYERESESEFNYNTEVTEAESESEFNYNTEVTERESESEFNYNTEITEEEFSESELESDLPLEQNVFKSPKGFPPLRVEASKVYEYNKSSPIKPSMNKTSWHEDSYEDSCDVTSLSDAGSYDGSSISTDIRPTADHKSYSSGSSVGSYYDPESSKESEENFTKSSCGSNSNSDTPLLYTVSFYRKQRQETRTPPLLKTIITREQTPISTSKNQTEAIQGQIKFLQEEILKQQTIIGQTSQALNLCHATAEFSGSSEQVEGERLLLIATQKRQALLNEIQRLKAHGAEGEGVCDGTGTLTISDLQLPLKQEFLAAQLEGRINDAVHWFLCLVRYGAQVIVTQMVSTDDKVNNGALCFTNHIKLQNLPPDFSVVFEVYALQTKKECLPHDKKYHIKRDKSTLRLTPKGKKSNEKLLLPAVSSPGGPNAVRSPSFGVIGFTRFTIQNCHKKCFTLDKVPFTSPLDGVLRVKLHLHAEHKVMEKGFLTMFADVSGFGAWHRRWCVLNAQHLTYWKYPDDEQKKDPIGTIELKQCVTAQVKPVARDVCARAHTFQLVTVRPQAKGDKNNLVTQCSNTLTTTKHLLSADTKEERILWCNKLNEALTNVRKWDPHAAYPVETNHS